MAIYLIVVLALTNLLIAMFNRTYEEVEAESLELWRFQFNELLEEYRSRPMLPNPLSLFGLLARGIKFLWRSLFCCNQRSGADISQDEETTRQQELRSSLERFQEKHTERYLDIRKLQLQQRDSERLRRLEDTVEDMSALLAEMHSQSETQRNQLKYHMDSLTDRLDEMNGRGLKRLNSIGYELDPHKSILTITARQNKHAFASELYMRSPDRKNFTQPDDSAWTIFEAGHQGTVVFVDDKEIAGSPDDRLISCFDCERRALAAEPRTKDGEVPTHMCRDPLTSVLACEAISGASR